MDNDKLLELIEIQEKQIKLLSEQVNLLKERQDIHKDVLERLTNNVLSLWDFVGKGKKKK